jgi:DNA-binding NarL/FixJ family response regulator
MRLVLCDDQLILGEALASALEARGYRVLAITTTPAACIAAVAACQPDVCLLDLHFFGHGSGLDAARAIRQHHSGTSVLVLSGLTDPAVLSEAKEAGVAGFIRKDQNVDEIGHALDTIAAGGTVFDPRGAVMHPARPQRPDPLRELTPREREILTRVVAGEGTKQMARAMRITTGTVQTYVKNVLAKLGVHSRLEVAALVSRKGLMDHLPTGLTGCSNSGPTSGYPVRRRRKPPNGDYPHG